ncbi:MULTISPECIES: hypothetical protein [unclassified Duganella]|uniref:hypothetical protein n=1 Tax=unclassified Duganella TaxID=2636909 RepID=UPI0006FD4EA3|nr:MULTISPECIES: hypothetical protein [unclassified Duganella]KQV59418.1 hypothetical protein ASD07_24700 [Duganella sp. Root336D2]KRC01512.1 hypothetical protein ASE26_21065 [Duganella sp. Root198D2]
MSQQINLFNPIFMRQRHSLGARGMALALLAMAAGTIAITIFADQQLQPLRKQASQQEMRLKERQARVQAVAAEFAPRPSDPVLKAELATKESRLKSLQQAMQMLRQAEGEGAAGFAEYFRALARQSVSGLWLTEVAVEGERRDVSMQGRVLQAALVPAYLSRLGGEPVLRGKSFQTLELGPAAVQAPAADVAGNMPLTALPPVAGSTAAGALAAAAAPAEAPPPVRFLEFRLRSTAAVPSGVNQ